MPENVEKIRTSLNAWSRGDWDAALKDAASDMVLRQLDERRRMAGGVIREPKRSSACGALHGAVGTGRDRARRRDRGPKRPRRHEHSGSLLRSRWDRASRTDSVRLDLGVPRGIARASDRLQRPSRRPRSHRAVGVALWTRSSYE